ncbi:hypothetical protein Pelo_15532 [Pelomyxa schiedti]|nr:hypothetical protein Pelo_15532 [Pelomyxa schiedti]
MAATTASGCGTGTSTGAPVPDMLDQRLKTCLFGDAEAVVAKRIFRASVNGFESTQFHAICDNRGPTLVIARTPSGHVFGGFTRANWASVACGYVADSSGSTFLFSAKRPGHPRDANSVIKFQIPGTNAIHAHPGYGPTFGDGHDLHISNLCNGNQSSYTKLPYRCTMPDRLPDTLSLSSELWNTFFAGSYAFTVEDYEVYSIFGI